MLNSSASKVFYGKHFYPGVAEYADTGTRILVKEDVIRQMNPTFAGLPVFVGHKGDEIDGLSMDELKEIKDGTVVRSFFNEADGATWIEFMVESQKGLDAIAKGYKLSNAYTKLETDPTGGIYIGQKYSEELLSGKYHHMAIVQSPRYSDSIILNPEEFKKYNEAKKAELARLQNSADEEKQEKSMSLNFFKKTKLEKDQAVDFENLYITLPRSKREVSLVQIINEADEELKELKDQFILVNEEKDERMTIEEAIKEIKDLRNKCNELEKKLAAQNEEDKKEDKKDNEDEKKEDKKDNEEDKKEDKKDNEDKKEEDKKDNECDKKNEDDKEKKNEEEKKEDKKIEKNFLNEIVNAKQLCDSAPAVHRVISLEERVALGRKYF